MSGTTCEFYADADDLGALLREFQPLGTLKFVQVRSRANAANDMFTGDLTALLAEALISKDRPTRTQSFLVMERDQEVFSRDIALGDGSGTVTIIDQNQNPNSVALAFGGDAGDRTLIMSEIVTTAETDVATELRKNCKKLVASMSKRVGLEGKPVQLMPGALIKAKFGWRLARTKGGLPGTDPVFLRSNSPSCETDRVTARQRFS